MGAKNSWAASQISFVLLFSRYSIYKTAISS
jgi:hypothetical protein